MLANSNHKYYCIYLLCLVHSASPFYFPFDYGGDFIPPSVKLKNFFPQTYNVPRISFSDQQFHLY